MKLGICTSTKYSSILQKAGFDYIELALAPIGLMNEKAFAEYAASVSVPSPAFNGFFDRNVHKLVGEQVNLSLIENFTRTALQRAAKMGCKTAVLGSGYSRQVPDGFDKSRALSQFKNTVILAGKIAAEYGIVIAVEPLNYRETNLLNTYAETAEFTRKIGMDNVGVTADFYHIVQNNEGWDGLYQNADMLQHVHICHPETRMAPKPNDGFDYGEFKKIFDRIGYNGLVSVEGHVPNPEQDIPDCAKALMCIS
ncbi:MAG TPA: sugar phosphate isomerase/epimerase family protein [Oscillospiraceae bacterium]|nr:sugar phosphate isomerase/epimerase family protein [Oscillospiraceae bacterium]HPF55554.1 sugar phosphate isomerase/epimerase family protein [Clostridiales bacterium]HPK34660.1 sugar phosphate isomerase/epimerase family protein [Oscillospiraceae bacterium]HPR74576.1 sugar phosphate isomerase/epimerase family protein [Oscillospiraceae bacterium]